RPERRGRARHLQQLKVVDGLWAHVMFGTATRQFSSRGTGRGIGRSGNPTMGISILPISTMVRRYTSETVLLFPKSPASIRSVTIRDTTLSTVTMTCKRDMSH